MREIIPIFLHKIDKIEKSNLVFKRKMKCDNLKEVKEWNGQVKETRNILE